MFFAADTAPRFRNGAIALISSSVATVFVVVGIAWLQRRDEKRIGGLVKQSDFEELVDNVAEEKGKQMQQQQLEIASTREFTV